VKDYEKVIIWLIVLIIGVLTTFFEESHLIGIFIVAFSLPSIAREINNLKK